MVKQRTVDCHASSSGLNSRYILLYFNRPQRALSLSRVFIQFSLKPAYPTIAWKIFQIYGV